MMDGLRDLPDGSLILEFDNPAQLTVYLREYQKFRCSLFVSPIQQGNGLLIPSSLRVQRRYVFLPEQGIELIRLVKHLEEFAKKSLLMHPVSLMCFENVASGANQYLLAPRLQTTLTDRHSFEKYVYDTLVQWLEPRIGLRLSAFSARHASMWVGLCERIYAWTILGYLKIQTRMINESHIRQLESGFPLALTRARLPEIDRILSSLQASKGITVVAMSSFEETVTLMRTLSVISELRSHPVVIVEGQAPCNTRLPGDAVVLLNAVDYSLDASMRSWLFENAESRHVVLFLHKNDGAFRSVMSSARTSAAGRIAVELLPFTHQQVADWMLSLCLPQDYPKMLQAVQSFSRGEFLVLRQLAAMLSSPSYVVDSGRLLADFNAFFGQNSLATLDRLERRVVEIVHLCLERPDEATVDYLLGERSGFLLERLREQGVVDEVNGWFIVSAKPQIFTEIDASHFDFQLARYYEALGRVCLANFHYIRSGSINDVKVLTLASEALADLAAPVRTRMALFSLVFEQMERGRLTGNRDTLIGFLKSGARLYESDVDYLRRFRSFMKKLNADPLEESSIFIAYLEALKRQGSYVEALDQGVAFVQALGLNIDRAPSDFSVFVEILKTWGSIFRSGGKIIQLREDDASSERSEVLNRVLWVLGGAAYMSTPKLLAVFSAIGVRLGLRYGMRQESMLGIAGFAYLEQEIALQRIWPASAKRAINILEQAREAVTRQPILGYDVRADLVEFGMVRPWHDGQLHSSIERLRDSYLEGTRSGDEEYALYCAAIGVLTHLIAGGSLEHISREIESPFIHAVQANQRTTVKNLSILLEFVSSCSGVPLDYHESDVPPLNMPSRLAAMVNEDRTAAAVYYALSGFKAFIFGEYQTLEELTEYDADQMIEGVQGQQLTVLITFIAMVAHLRLSKPQIRPSRSDRKEAARRLKDLLRWAKSSPLNYDGIATLASALHRHRLHGGALHQFARACDACESRGQLHWAAIAREHLGFAELNASQMVEGRKNIEYSAQLFERWGATQKASQLRETATQVFYPVLPATDAAYPSAAVIPYIRVKQFETLYDPSQQSLHEYLASGFQTLALHGVTRISVIDPLSRQELSYCTRTRVWGNFLAWKTLRSLLSKAQMEREKSIVDTNTGEILVWLGSHGDSDQYLYARVEDSSSQKVHIVHQALKRHRGTIGLALASSTRGAPETERLAEFTAAGTEELRAALEQLNAIEGENVGEARKLLSGVIAARLEMAAFLRSARFTGFSDRLVVLEQSRLDGIVKELLSPLNIHFTDNADNETFMRVHEQIVSGDSRVALSTGKDGGDAIVIDKPVTAVKLLKAIIAKERRLKGSLPLTSVSGSDHSE